MTPTPPPRTPIPILLFAAKFPFSLRNHCQLDFQDTGLLLLVELRLIFEQRTVLMRQGQSSLPRKCDDAANSVAQFLTFE